MKVWLVQIVGWGSNSDEHNVLGVYSSEAKALEEIAKEMRIQEATFNDFKITCHRLVKETDSE